jgi:hypothetical protein
LPVMVRDTLLPMGVTWWPGFVIVTGVAVVQLTGLDPVRPALSVAVTLLVVVPGVEGVPVTAPVLGLIDKPAGKPVADQV